MTPEKIALQLFPYDHGDDIVSCDLIRHRIADAIIEAENRGADEVREACVAVVREVLEKNLAEKSAAILARIRHRSKKEGEAEASPTSSIS